MGSTPMPYTVASLRRTAYGLRCFVCHVVIMIVGMLLLSSGRVVWSDETANTTSLMTELLRLQVQFM